MTLLDSNVVIYAAQQGSVHHGWARRIISRAVASDGAAVNAVCLAEVCAPQVPLPDFFVGAHAQIMDWSLATADAGRIRTYFPTVRLVVP